VSNSSSSSFCIVGKEIDNPLERIKNGKKVWVIVEGGGNSGECEDWAMELNLETFEILMKSKWYKHNQEYSAFIEASDNAIVEYDSNKCDNILSVEKDIDECVFAFNRDYSSPDNKEELIDFLEDY
jgi:hypothetical protein